MWSVHLVSLGPSVRTHTTHRTQTKSRFAYLQKKGQKASNSSVMLSGRYLVETQIVEL